MLGLDASAMIPLVFGDHPHHAWAFRCLASEPGSVAVAPLVLAEFVHAVTDERRFQHPLAVGDALSWVDGFLRREATIVIAPTESAMRLWLRWMAEHRLGRKRTLDTQLSATLHTAGVRRLLTTNPDDFRIFGTFELLTPE